MATSFNRRTKVLLALVVSMTLGAGVLMALVPEVPRLDTPQAVALIGGQQAPPVSATPAPYLQSETRLFGWQRVVVHSLQPQRAVGDYHFVIDATGSIRSTQRWTMQRPAVDGQGQETRDIHVALVGEFEGQTLTQDHLLQIQALRELCRQLCEYLQLPSGRVYLHRELGGEPCPGSKFPADWKNAPLM